MDIHYLLKYPKNVKEEHTSILVIFQEMSPFWYFGPSAYSHMCYECTNYHIGFPLGSFYFGPGTVHENSLNWFIKILHTPCFYN